MPCRGKVLACVCVGRPEVESVAEQSYLSPLRLRLTKELSWISDLAQQVNRGLLVGGRYQCSTWWEGLVPHSCADIWMPKLLFTLSRCYLVRLSGRSSVWGIHRDEKSQPDSAPAAISA